MKMAIKMLMSVITKIMADHDNKNDEEDNCTKIRQHEFNLIVQYFEK